MKKKITNAFIYISILGITGVYLFLGLRNFEMLGAYYDELLHVIPAQQIVSDHKYQSDYHATYKVTFGDKTFPLYILYYVGALKTYALLPFLEVSEYRQVTIGFGYIALMIFIYILYKKVNKKIAIISGLLLASSPSYILSARYDWGPVTVQNILIATLILLLTTKSRSIGKNVLLIVVSGLLLWEKITGVWFISGLFVIYIYVHREAIKLKHILLGTVGCLLLGMIVYILMQHPFTYSATQADSQTIINHIQQSPKNFSITKDLQQKAQTLIHTLEGTAIPNTIVRQPTKANGLSLLLLLLTLSGIYTSINQKTSYYRSTLFMFIWLIICIFLTPFAYYPHHMIILLPFVYMYAAQSIVYSRKAVSKIAIFIGLLTTIVISLNTFVQFDKAVTQNQITLFWQKVPFTSLTQKLTNVTKTIYSLDWGISLPVAYYSKGEIPIKNLEPANATRCNQIQEKNIYVTLKKTDFLEKNPAWCWDKLKHREKIYVDQFIIFNALK